MTAPDPTSVARPARPWWPRWGFMIAQPLTAWALVLVVTTFATNDYTSILKQAIGCALASLLLVALVFRRVSRFNQVLGTGLGVVDLFVLWHAAFERGLVW